MIFTKRVVTLVLSLVFILTSFQIFGQALEHKPMQKFLSPYLSGGVPTIINQNNYGYSEPSFALTLGGQFGLMFGWDNYLRQSLKTGLVLSKFGQHYTDDLARVNTKKNVDLYYVQVPLIYKHVFGRKRGYDHEVYSPYVFGGLSIGYLFYANVDFLMENESGSYDEKSLVEFVTGDGSWNANTDQIIQQGNPEKDRHLFASLDIELSLGGGYQYFISRRTSLFAEAQITYGIMDINAGEWRFKSNKNVYRSSYNLYGGINFGANIYIYD